MKQEKNHLTLVEAIGIASKVENWRISDYDWRERPTAIRGEIEGITISVTKLNSIFRKKLGPSYNIRVWDLVDYCGLKDNSIIKIYETALEKIASSPLLKPEKESQESLLSRAKEISYRKDKT